MNLRSIILQTGALAFCVSIIALSLTGYSVLEIIIISFIVFIIVTLLATVIISMFFPPPKEIPKKDDLLTGNSNILENAMNKEKSDSLRNENVKDKKDEPKITETNSATAKE